ncbi:prenyltransferase/squalene oxidase repeat-containing protein [Saccharothrix yanglingensis]|uniref:prenyltransferase/squalene oxidase repeat-containing protein n=1 Tax=Saccharothrix yanglingensis TaxID=659496 RepID=UPI0027D2BF3D|nr:prenyltransferase/squalene oxidase repeat-containing protein [Saccharothrix yanglingensis]
MPLRRTAAAAVALAALAAAPAAQAWSTEDRAGTAGGWLTRQLVGGDHLEIVVDGVAYPDQGLTLDLGFALAAADVARDGVERIGAWVSRPEVMGNYLHFDAPERESYAGAHAKLALFASVSGADPTDFGGVDLVAGLTALKAPSGRFTDRTAYQDYSNGFTQAFAVLALDRAGGAPRDAVDFLAGGRCPDDGGYPLVPATAPCTSHVDATAMAVQALLAADRPDDAAPGLTWLERRQADSGGFAGEDGSAEGNANSTGLAAQALRMGGRTGAADRAVAFLESLQVGCSGPEADRGAFAFDRTGFATGSATRATTQAVLGVAGVGYAALSSVGDRTGAPVLDCAGTPPGSGTTTTTTTTGTTGTGTTTTAASTPDATSTTDAPPATTTTTTEVVAVGGGGTLARTGVAVGPALWLGALLVVGGALVLALARERHVARGRR